MPRSPSRRALLAAAATASLSGCFDVLREDEECHIEHGSWQGEAEAIATDVEVDLQDDPALMAARVAAGAAFAQLNERSDVDLEGKQWIGHAALGDDDQYDVFVWVRETRGRDDGVRLCPDSSFTLDDARGALPRRVTVTAHLGDVEDTETYTHDIELRSQREKLD